MTQVVEQEVIQLHAEICAALAEPKRILMLYELANGPRNVTDLAASLSLSQSLASRHLKVLRERGLVSAVLRDNLAHRAELLAVSENWTPPRELRRTHYYQPGLLFIPFGVYTPDDVVRLKRNFLPAKVEFVFSDIESLEPDHSRVTLAKDRRVIRYDELVIATGSRIVPEETPGLKGNGWHHNIFDFYTLPGATALARHLKFWQGGRLVLNVAEMPIKCPVAPLEFLFLADWFFHQRGLRDKVELIYATPLPGAFTKPRASAILSDLLQRKSIHLEADFNLAEVDGGRQVITSYDGREVPYDLFVTIPVHMGAEFLGPAGLGDELNFVPTDKHTLQSTKF